MKSVPSSTICPVRNSQHLHVFSDYSSNSHYDTYSFLLADLVRSLPTLDGLQLLRQQHNLTRRMSYKNLRDRVRLRVAPAFCDLASQMQGHVMTFAVSKKIGSLFSVSEDSSSDSDSLCRIADKYRKSREHLARVLHFFGLSIAGLTTHGQNIDWYTDVDVIAPEQSWLEDLVEIAANLSSHYLPHTLGEFRVGTTRNDDGSLLLEDLCAIPDLMAGSIAELLSNMTCHPLAAEKGLIVPLSSSTRQKAIAVTYSLRNSAGSLKSTCVCLEPDCERLRIQLRYFHEMPLDIM